MEPIDFSWYLNGNPAMLEIWSDAMNRLEAQVELAPVQEVVIREWLHRARANRNELQLRAQRGMLSDEQYAELAALDTQIKNIEISINRAKGSAMGALDEVRKAEIRKQCQKMQQTASNLIALQNPGRPEKERNALADASIALREGSNLIEDLLKLLMPEDVDAG